MSQSYDVIIIGGRIAGASLAIRLGRQKLKVLLLDRATFPSWPAVPSSPLVHPGTIRLLDELGLDEAEYASPDGKATHFILDMMGKFQAVMPFALMGLDRNYVYGIDRNRLDALLWQRAAEQPTVTARQNVAMTDVLRDGAGRVTGIVGRTGNEQVVFHGDLVVGADGRFSLAARKFGAQPFLEYNDYPGASYHAEWEGVADYSQEISHPLMMCPLGGGYALLVIPVDRQRYIIANHMRSADAGFRGEELEAHYLRAIQRVPHLWQRLASARQVTPIVGIRRIENGYRQAYGDGWALVGDAFHYESPLDGQGIYNALLASGFLVDAVSEWREGRAWQEAGLAYQQRFYDASHEMLKQTVARLRQETYSDPPPFVINTLLRWQLTDPAYQKNFLLYISRAIDPKSFTMGPSPGPILRGLLRDIFGGRRRKEAPYPAALEGT